MSALDTFLSHVRPWAPGVPDPTAFKNIRLAAIEFCERTRLWKYDITVAISEQKAAPVAPTYSAIHAIESATLNGLPLAPITRAR